MLLILNWIKITQDWIQLSLTLFSYLLYLTLLLLGLHYESAGEKAMLSQMDRSEGDYAVEARIESGLYAIIWSSAFKFQIKNRS